MKLQGYFCPRTDRTHHTTEAKRMCVCRWGTERLRVSGHLELRSAKTLSLFSQSRDVCLLYIHGAVAVLWKSREKLVREEGKSPRHGHGGRRKRADYSLCWSLGDASVNARAMSRRKQGNPQHLSQREIITRKSLVCFNYLCLWISVGFLSCVRLTDTTPNRVRVYLFLVMDWSYENN